MNERMNFMLPTVARPSTKAVEVCDVEDGHDEPLPSGVARAVEIVVRFKESAGAG